MEIKNITNNTSKKTYIELLRIIAAFLVIVNHTNSRIFLESSVSVTWFASLVYFFVCKIAVPIFLFIMGAVLLGKQDTHARNWKRILRMTGILVSFSLIYYIYDCYINDDKISIGAFVSALSIQATNSFWYLYMYIGMLITLPYLQKLLRVLSLNEIRILILFSLGISGISPILFDFFGLGISKHTYEVFFHPYVGMVFAGYYMDVYFKKSKRSFVLAILTFIVMIAVQVFLTWKTYLNNPDNVLILDHNTYCPIVLSAACVYYVVQYLFSCIDMSDEVVKIIRTLGGLMFSVYLISDLVIDITQSVYVVFLSCFDTMQAMIVWEILIFMVCILVAVVMKRLPVLKSVL